MLAYFYSFINKQHNLFVKAFYSHDALKCHSWRSLGKNKLDSVVYFLISVADVAYSHSGITAEEL